MKLEWTSEANEMVTRWVGFGLNLVINQFHWEICDQESQENEIQKREVKSLRWKINLA